MPLHLYYLLQVIQYREQSDLAFMLLIKSQHLDERLNLDELMRYSLSPVSHSLGSADGFFYNKTKAMMLHYPADDISDAYLVLQMLYTFKMAIMHFSMPLQILLQYLVTFVL